MQDFLFAKYEYPSHDANISFYDNGFNYRDMLSNLPSDFYKIYLDIINKTTTKESIVLDVGCGVVNTTAEIAKTRKTIGLNCSFLFLNEAKKNFKNAAFVKADLCSLPFLSESIDCIGLFDVLEHVYDAEKFFVEAKRVLRKSGRLLIISPNSASPLIPALNFYYSKKYGFKKGDIKYISFSCLIKLTVIYMPLFIKEFFSSKYSFKYNNIDIYRMKYTDEDAIFYMSYFTLTKYLKRNGFNVVKHFAAPITKLKYVFGKAFPFLFTSIYILAEKNDIIFYI